MTYSETIDNINNRIENIISDRLPQTYQHITIEPSDYNPSIDDTITVTITVTDQADSPVSGFTVPLQINGESITGLVTNSSGVVTYNYTCDEWGTIKFAVKSYTAFINVGGWKEYSNTENYKIFYNDEYVWFRFDYSANSGSISTSWWELGAEVFADSYIRPSTNVFFLVGNLVVGNVRPDQKKFRARTVSGTINAPFTLTGEVMWKRK